MKKTWIAVIVIVVLVGVGIYYFSNSSVDTDLKNGPGSGNTPGEKPVSTATTSSPTVRKEEEVIGKSIEGRDILAYHFGMGNTEILFVGGIHGGYSRNTAAAAYEAIEYFKNNLSSIPKNVSITVIPVVNPDGLNKLAGMAEPSESTRISARFNANNVDLNRNFDCDWQPTGKWQSRTVSGGSIVFSEPESQAVRDYLMKYKPSAAVIWYSAAGAVFSSNCGNGVLSETRTLTNLFAKAAGYPAFETFDYYEITGDMANWLAKQEVPAISVLLKDHDSTEWAKNELGIKALLAHYAQ